jgi:hypothetical protein
MLAILEGDLSRLQSGQENVSNPLSYVLESCWSRKGAMPFSISITPNRILQKIAKKGLIYMVIYLQ